VLLVGGILVAWYLYRKASSALTTPANIVADTIFRLTAPPAAQVLGRVRLPDGSLVTFQEIVNAGGIVSGNGSFPWRGSLYQISGREDSVYVARRLVT
jgi:hypothetical protein